MNISNVILILAIGINSLWGQHQITGVVLDGDEPLTYVNIGVIGTSVGTVSDLDGSFSLILPAAMSLTDTLRFSRIGYQSRDVYLKEWKKGDSLRVKMLPEISELPQVEVRPWDEVVTKGKKRTNAGLNVSFALGKQPRQNLGSEIAKKFRLKKRQGKLKSIRFFISYNDFDKVIFRIHLYQGKQSKPIKFLTAEQILVEVSDRKTGWIEVDLNPHLIPVDNDIMVGVQWIHYSGEGRLLRMPIIFPAIAGHHFYKYGSQNKWKHFRNMSTNIGIEVQY